MSSNKNIHPRDESDGEGEGSSSNKRKISRACDICRRRKHRCDGGETADNRCTNCANSNLLCTYDETSKRRATPKGYVESLELRLKRMSEIITSLDPNLDLEEELGGPLVLDQSAFTNRRPAIKPPEPFFSSFSVPASQPQRMREMSISSESSTHQPGVGASISSYNPLPTPYHLPFKHIAAAGAPTPPLRTPARASSDRVSLGFPSSNIRPSVRVSQAREDPPISAAEKRQKGKDEDEDTFVRQFVTLTRPAEAFVKSFMGKSSGLPLLWSAMGFKYGENSQRYWEEIALNPSSQELTMFRTPIWEITPIPPPWTPDVPPPASIELFALTSPNVFDGWPDQSLAAQLIHLFFGSPSECLPLLQKSHFISQYASRLYSQDMGFARLCLLVFAVASLYSTDLRVRFPSEDGGTEDIRSRGWIYYHAYRKIPKAYLAPTDLYDLQCSVLLTTFLRVQVSMPRVCWDALGQGLRMAVDVGMHRKGTQRSSDLVETELFRRAFWCLQILDVEYSGIIGRPLNLPEEEYDADLNFNAAFWEDQDQQLGEEEEGLRVPAFVLHTQLSVIAARVSTHLYGISPRTNTPLGSSSMEVVRNLSLQLDEWYASIPPRLVWDPTSGNSLAFRLSSSLHLAYQDVVAFLHRPFLPSPQHPISTSTTFMATTFAAAFASVQVIVAYVRETEELLPSAYYSLYSAALVLCVAVWGGKSTSGDGTLDASVAMDSVEKCVELLERFAKFYWGTAKTLAPISALAAPRIDYHAESFARRTAREARVAEVEAAQIAAQVATVAAVSRSPYAHSLSHSPSQPSPPPGAGGSSHLLDVPGGGLSSFVPSTSPAAGTSVGGATDFTNLDFFTIGAAGVDSLFGSVFPDFFNTGNDPMMTLFPDPTPNHATTATSTSCPTYPLNNGNHSAPPFSPSLYHPPSTNNQTDHYPPTTGADYANLASPSAWGGRNSSGWAGASTEGGGGE